MKKGNKRANNKPVTSKIIIRCEALVFSSGCPAKEFSHNYFYKEVSGEEVSLKYIIFNDDDRDAIETIIRYWNWFDEENEKFYESIKK